METDVPDDSLVRETIASLGPGAKDFILDDLAAWIRQLEELCYSQDAALAPASFRTDINGSCRSKFPESGKKPATTARITEMQTKAVKGYPPLTDLHMEKVSSNKKNARGEEKLRLRVDRGPVLVMLTIIDLDGATHTLHAVTADANDLVPIKHPGTRIETTVIPFTPDQLLKRLLQVEAKIKPQRDEYIQPRASAAEKVSVDVEQAPAYRRADGAKCMTKRVDAQVFEYIFDPKKGTVTMKTSGCPNPYCDDVDCTGTPATYSLNLKTREIETPDSTQVGDVIAPMLKSFQVNPRRLLDLAKRVAAIVKEERAIHKQLSTAKPAEKKRLIKELEKKNAEYAKLKDLMFRTAETGGWLGVSEEELFALLENAKKKDAERVDALACRAQAALDEYNEIVEKLETIASHTKKTLLLKQLGRKEIEFDEAMNDIAVIADGSGDENGSEPEEWQALTDVSIRIACRALAAFDEYKAIKEEFESFSSHTKKKRASTLFGRKWIEFDEAINDIVGIADASEDEYAAATKMSTKTAASKKIATS